MCFKSMPRIKEGKIHLNHYGRARESQLEYFCPTKQTLLSKLRYYGLRFWFLLFSAPKVIRNHKTVSMELSATAIILNRARAEATLNTNIITVSFESVAFCCCVSVCFSFAKGILCRILQQNDRTIPMMKLTWWVRKHTCQLKRERISHL